MEKLGVGIVGLGMGKSHLQAFDSNKRTEIVGICDLNEELVKSVAKEFGIPHAYTDFEEFISCEGLNLVSIATPDQFHSYQAIGALEAGKHVLVEKPMARSIDECWEVIDAAKSTGMKVMVGQVCRFMTRYEMAKRFVEQGLLGEIFYAESDYPKYGVPNYTPPAWRSRIENRPIGPFGGGIHAVDLLRWIVGEVTEVYGVGSHKAIRDYPLDDCIVALLKFENEAIGKVLAAVGCQKPYSLPLTLYGTEGSLLTDNRIDPLAPTGTVPPVEIFLKNIPGLTSFMKLPVPYEGKPIETEVNYFVQYVSGEGIPPLHRLDAVEGARSVAVCVAAVESIRLGRPVAPEKFK